MDGAASRSRHAGVFWLDEQPTKCARGLLKHAGLAVLQHECGDRRKQRAEFHALRLRAGYRR